MNMIRLIKTRSSFIVIRHRRPYGCSFMVIRFQKLTTMPYNDTGCYAVKRITRPALSRNFIRI